MEGKGWGKIGPPKKAQRSAGKKIDCCRMLVNVGWRGGWKTQPILWTERPTGAVMEADSLWLLQGWYFLRSYQLGKSMPNGTSLSGFITSRVNCLVSPPSLSRNLKRWTRQSERLFNFHHLGQSLYLANQKQSFPATSPLRGTYKMCTFPGPQQFHSVFLQIFIEKVWYRGILVLLLGIL
jgi:hypothetical protein